MTLKRLKNFLKDSPLVRSLYFVVRDGKYRVANRSEIKRFTQQFRGYDVLVLRDRPVGLFAIFLQALLVLQIARKHKQRVVFQFDRAPYCDPERPEDSWLSYYFDSSDDAVWQEVTDTTSEQNIYEINAKEVLDRLSRLSFNFPRDMAHPLISEFVPKQELAEAVKTFKQTHFGEAFVVGLHYRGTDKVEGGQEAIRVNYESINETLDTITSLGFTYHLFVATDEEALIRHLKAREDITISYTNSLRSNSNWPVHFSEGQRSGYQLGFEAILDCLLLSECDFLLRTESNLSRTSEFFNPDMPSINLTREYGYSRNDLTKPPNPNLKSIRKKVSSAYRRKQRG